MASNPPPEKRGKGQSHQITPPSISLAKGGGAIHDIGGNLAVNPVSSSGAITMPIATSPSRSGFGPRLSLSYHADSGSGPFGFSWSLSLQSFGRRTMDCLDTGTSRSPASCCAPAPKPCFQPSRKKTMEIGSVTSTVTICSMSTIAIDIASVTTVRALTACFLK
jgi:hypothetical protein